MAKQPSLTPTNTLKMPSLAFGACSLELPDTLYVNVQKTGGRSVGIVAVRTPILFGQLTVGTIKSNVYLNEDADGTRTPKVGNVNGKVFTFSPEVKLGFVTHVNSQVQAWAFYSRAIIAGVRELTAPSTKTGLNKSGSSNPAILPMPDLSGFEGTDTEAAIDVTTLEAAIGTAAHAAAQTV